MISVPRAQLVYVVGAVQKAGGFVLNERETLSVLQVVENPGWLLPYVSCIVVGAGLAIHFLFALFRSLKRAGAS